MKPRFARATLFVFLLLWPLFPASVYSQTMEEALEQAVAELKRLGLTEARASELAIDFVNGHTKEEDRDAAVLRGALYGVLHRAYPAARIVLEEEAEAGVSGSAVFVKGVYLPRGKRVTVTLRAVGDRVSGTEIARAEAVFVRKVASVENLVAVLPLEAPDLSASAREAFTRVFRSALIASGRFDLISSDAVDRVDPDRVQEEYGCTREQCSVIVAESLNAGLVLTPTYTKIGEGHYLLAGSLKDIKKGSTVREHTVRHDGRLETLDAKLKSLACRLAETCDHSTGQVEFTAPEVADGAVLPSGFTPVTPQRSGDGASAVASLILESDPPQAELILYDAGGETVLGKTPYQNFRFKAGQRLRIALRKELYHERRLEFRLQGGMNDLGTVGLKPAFGALEIVTDPPGAELLLAGSKRGKTPFRGERIKSGSYLFSLNKPLYLPVENRRIAVKDGETAKERIRLEPNFGVVEIATSPPGAEAVATDAQNRRVAAAVAPATLRLSPGSYRLTLRKEGYEPLQFKLSVARGKKQTIGPQTAALRKREGFVMVSTAPLRRGAEILVDGRSAGKVPAHFSLPPGEYRIEVRLNGSGVGQTVAVQDRQTVALTLDVGKIAPKAGAAAATQQPQAASELEAEMWEMVKESQDAADLEVFLESFPQGGLLAPAHGRLLALSSASIASLAAYLRKYPNSPRKTQAERKIWELTVAENSPEAVESYLKKYPNSPYRKQGEKRIWELTVAADSIDTMEGYLKKHPNSPYRKQGEKRIRELTFAENSLSGYRRFIERFPQSRFVGFAKLKAAKLEREARERWLKAMVSIPAGEFSMGSNKGDSDEKPPHTVSLDEFLIDKQETTVADYKKCVEAGKCEEFTTRYWGGKDQGRSKYCNWTSSGRDDHPINCVDWFNAQKYCAFVGKRLPTEAEWERAASWKNGKKYKYPSGKSSVSCADAVMDDGGDGCGKDRTWEVGSKPEEINGTYDMAGNVWEWVLDRYDSDYYDQSPRSNPQGPDSATYRVFRGGGWGNTASYLRGARRRSNGPSSRGNDLGFRCAVSP